jgi:hypothetical protein
MSSPDIAPEPITPTGTRTDELNGIAKITVPNSWTRTRFANGYVYGTRCEHLGIVAYRWNKANAAQIVMGFGYAPMSASGIAYSVPGRIEVVELSGGRKVQAQWSGIPGCDRSTWANDFQQLARSLAETQQETHRQHPAHH